MLKKTEKKANKDRLPHNTRARKEDWPEWLRKLPKDQFSSRSHFMIETLTAAPLHNLIDSLKDTSSLDGLSKNSNIFMNEKLIQSITEEDKASEPVAIFQTFLHFAKPKTARLLPIFSTLFPTKEAQLSDEASNSRIIKTSHEEWVKSKDCAAKFNQNPKLEYLTMAEEAKLLDYALQAVIDALNAARQTCIDEEKPNENLKEVHDEASSQLDMIQMYKEDAIEKNLFEEEPASFISDDVSLKRASRFTPESIARDTGAHPIQQKKKVKLSVLFNMLGKLTKGQEELLRNFYDLKGFLTGPTDERINEKKPFLIISSKEKQMIGDRNINETAQELIKSGAKNENEFISLSKENNILKEEAVRRSLELLGDATVKYDSLLQELNTTKGRVQVLDDINVELEKARTRLKTLSQELEERIKHCQENHVDAPETKNMKFTIENKCKELDDRIQNMLNKLSHTEDKMSKMEVELVNEVKNARFMSLGYLDEKKVLLEDAKTTQREHQQEVEELKIQNDELKEQKKLADESFEKQIRDLKDKLTEEQKKNEELEDLRKEKIHLEERLKKECKEADLARQHQSLFTLCFRKVCESKMKSTGVVPITSVLPEQTQKQRARSEEPLQTPTKDMDSNSLLIPSQAFRKTSTIPDKTLIPKDYNLCLSKDDPAASFEEKIGLEGKVQSISEREELEVTALLSNGPVSAQLLSTYLSAVFNFSDVVILSPTVFNNLNAIINARDSKVLELCKLDQETYLHMVNSNFLILPCEKDKVEWKLVIIENSGLLPGGSTKHISNGFGFYYLESSSKGSMDQNAASELSKKLDCMLVKLGRSFDPTFSTKYPGDVINYHIFSMPQYPKESPWASAWFLVENLEYFSREKDKQGNFLKTKKDTRKVYDANSCFYYKRYDMILQLLACEQYYLRYS